MRKLELSAFAIGVAAGLFALTLGRAEADGGWKVPPGKAAEKNPVASDESSLKAGETAYVKQCAECHGTGGKGDGPKAKERRMPDLTRPRVVEQSDGSLFYKITTGKRPMPGYAKTLSDQQRWSIVNYLRALAKKDGGEKKAF
jgi:mono/diheme cytochrome c family protein